MPKISGFSQYVCDRCGKTTFFSGIEVDEQRWRTIKRIDVMGVEATRLLCPECSGKYNEMLDEQDQKFQEFLVSKKPIESKKEEEGGHGN